jgi:hypothetical protein
MHQAAVLNHQTVSTRISMGRVKFGLTVSSVNPEVQDADLPVPVIRSCLP